MLNYRVLATSSALALLITSSALAAEDIAPAQPAYKWAPESQIEGDAGIGHNDRDIGLPQVMAPLWQNNDSMVFTDLRFRFDNEQSQEYNIGLGYRKEINSDWILGGYGFFDKLSSASGELYSQGTFGLEALSINNDARVNVYIPQSTVHGAASGQVEIIGNQIGLAGGAERALPGEDFELGQKLPFNFADVRIYGGAYRYTADNFGMVDGPRGRIEFTINDQYMPAIPFGAEVSLGGEIEHDDMRGTQSFALVKLRIPFGGSVHDTTNTLDQRMNTFVERDIDIIEKTGNGSNGALQPVEANGVIISNVSRVQTGTTLDSAVTAAPNNSLILVNGGGGAINATGNVTMKSGQTLLGGGGTLGLTAANTGQSIYYTYAGVMPTVNSAGNSITVADNTQINNINFNGILAISVNNSNVDISHVNVTTATGGVYINAGNNISISDLTVTSPIFAGIELYPNTAVNNISFNNIQVTGAGFAGITLGSPSTITNLSITNSQLNNSPSAAGGGLYVASGGVIDGFSYNNIQTNNNNLNGIDLRGTITGLSGSGNTSTGNGGNDCNSPGTISGSVSYNGGSTCP